MAQFLMVGGIKTLRLYAAAMLVFFSAAAYGDSSVRIGAIVPLSGDMALHGTEIQKALQLAQKLHTPTNFSYQLLFEDNRLEGAKSIAAVRKLIEVDGVDCIVTLWPPTAEVVIPISEQKSILHYTISWDPELARRHRFVLSHQSMVDAIARSTLALAAHRGAKKIAFLHMEESGFNLGADYLRRAANETGVSFLTDESFSPEERDFRPLLTRTEVTHPDYYILWAVMPSLDTVVRQLRERNHNVQVSGYLDYAVDLQPLQGSEYVSEMFASENFIRAYTSAYGAAPVSKGANAFDIYNLIVSAYEQSPERKATSAEIKERLIRVRNFDGAVGKFSVDEFGNSTYSPVWRKIEGNDRRLAVDHE